MQPRHLLIAGVGLLAGVAAVSATYVMRSFDLHRGAPTVAGSRHLYAFGSRSASQVASPTARKFDAALAELSRHAPQARPDHALADLHAMHPAVRFRQVPGSSPEILIDAVTRGDPQALKAALVALGMEHAALYSNDVGGWLPVSQLDAAAARPEVLALRAAMPHRRGPVGPVALQGDFVQKSDVVRSTYPSLDGSGITVGVLSDSFDCYSVYAAPGSGVPASGNEGYAYNGFLATYADDVASGALPANVNVLAEPADLPDFPACMNYDASTQTPFTDEGRAMLQIVHVVAPNAALAFRTGDDSEADFALGVTTLASAVSAGGAGANIIADDLGYFDEPFYQDGIVAEAINTVVANGVAYFSAAGNDANASYENTAPHFGTTLVGAGLPNAGEYLLNFDPTGNTTTTGLQITIAPQAPGQFLAVVVEWDQPYVTGAPNSGGATSQIDVCVTGTTMALGEYLIQNYEGTTTNCTLANATGIDPVQVMIVGNPANSTISPPNDDTMQEILNIQVGLANGTVAPGRIIVSVETDGQTTPAPISSPFATNSASLQGHPAAAGAAAVAAAFYFDTPRCLTSPAAVEPFSSLGGAPILFDSSGNRLITPIVRQKPNFVGPDGVNNTFLGFLLADDGGEPPNNNGLLTTSISQCQNNTAYPNFFGTSAATPHAAGIAALMLQANSKLTPTQIYTALETSALPMAGGVPTSGGAGPAYNFSAGYGFIQADAALASVPPGAPMLSLSSSSVTVGVASTLTWSSTNASSCTATGTWSGPQSTSGTLKITPTAVGSYPYSLTCTNSVGPSTAATVTLNVAAPAVPAAPTLSLTANSIVVGSSATLSWSSSDATGCTASGSWSGAKATSGSQVETPASTGAYTYSLFCSNVTGGSAPSSVTLTVTAAPSSGGGGGGALDELTLIGLGLLGFALRRRALDEATRS
jgi:hypothetical protein